MTICPGCGSTEVLPGRIYCRPSCRAKHQWRQAQARPRLPFVDDVLATALDEADQAREADEAVTRTEGPR
jgi:hypothetical protein